MEGVDYRTLAEDFIRTRYLEEGVRTLQFASGQFWVWSSGRYSPIPKDAIGDALMYWLIGVKNLPNPKVRDNTLECVRAIVRASTRGPPPCWINPETDAEISANWLGFTNGVLDLTAWGQGGLRLRETSPRWFSTIILPYAFDPQRKCPRWDKCLTEWLGDDTDAIQVLQEYAGYCLTPDHSLEAGLFLEGCGANGKSVFSETLIQMLGPDNCSAVALEDFGRGFELAPTLGKLMNVATETAEGTRLPVSRVRAFISGDRMEINRKYMPHLQANQHPKLLVSWNRRPEVNDQSRAFWRRVLLVGFYREFRDGAEDRGLRRKLLDEIPGILNWALQGLRRLRKVGGFTRAASVEDVSASFRRDNDPLGMWLEDHLVISPGMSVRKEEVYQRYCLWATESEVFPVTKAELGRRLLRTYPGSRTRRSGSARVPEYTGIEFRGLP